MRPRVMVYRTKMKLLAALTLALTGSAFAVSPADAVRAWVAGMSATRAYSASCQTYNSLMEKQFYPTVSKSSVKFIEGQRLILSTEPSTSKSLVELYGTINGFKATDAWNSDGDILSNTFVNPATPKYAYHVALFAIPGDYGSTTAFCLNILGIR